MLELRNLNVSFQNKTVFDGADYCACAGKMNLIIGPSGTGKSTLMKALYCEYSAEYTIDGETLHLCGEKEQTEYLYHHVSCVLQEPVFDEDLTVRGNMEFLQKLYGLQDDAEETAEKLDIVSVLDQYPSKLSGGERTRAGIFLALLKRPSVLLLDEPTASLDADHKEAVIALLKEYAENHCVIIATHDERLIREDAYKAAIENHGIRQDVSAYTDAAAEKTMPDRKYDPLFSYRKSFFHHFPGKAIAALIASLCIVCMFLSFNLNNSLTEKLHQEMNQLSSRDLIIYKGLIDTRRYSYHGIEFPVQAEEMEKMMSFEKYGRIHPRIDFAADSYYYELYEMWFMHREFDWEDSSYIQLSVHEETAEPSFIDDAVYCFHVYDEDQDFSKNTVKQFSEKGVYVSQSLFERSGMSECRNPVITMTVPVPLYDVSGLSRTTDPETEKNGLDDSTVWIPCNDVICKPVQITMPVCAVLEDEYIQGALTAGIYIPSGEYFSWIENAEADEAHTVYYIAKDNRYYFDELPSEYQNETFPQGTGNNCIFKLTRWKPSGYTLRLNDLSDLYEAAADLQEAGFQIDSDYINTNALIRVQEDTRRTLILISTAVTLIMAAGIFVIQWNQRERMAGKRMFLHLCGLNEPEIRRSFALRMCVKTVMMSAISILLFIAAVTVLAKKNIVLIRPSYPAFLGIVAVSSLIFLAVPYLLYLYTCRNNN